MDSEDRETKPRILLLKWTFGPLSAPKKCHIKDPPPFFGSSPLTYSIDNIIYITCLRGTRRRVYSNEATAGRQKEKGTFQGGGQTKRRGRGDRSVRLVFFFFRSPPGSAVSLKTKWKSGCHPQQIIGC
jgi:hypothetical protein